MTLNILISNLESKILKSYQMEWDYEGWGLRQTTDDKDNDKDMTLMTNTLI